AEVVEVAHQVVQERLAVEGHKWLGQAVGEGTQPYPSASAQQHGGQLGHKFSLDCHLRSCCSFVTKGPRNCSGVKAAEASRAAAPIARTRLGFAARYTSRSRMAATSPGGTT